MLTPLQLTLAASLPFAYRVALDRHCRRLTRHAGVRPDDEHLMELTMVPIDEHPARVALAQEIAEAEAAMAAASPGSRAYLQAESRSKGLRARAGSLGRLLAYAHAFEATVEQLRACAGDDDILALLDAGPDMIRAEAIGRAELAHRTGDETRLSGAALIEHRRRCCAKTQARRLRKAVNVARLAVGVVLGEIGQLPGDRTQLYAPDLSVAASQQRDAATKKWAEGYVLTDGAELAVPMAELLKGAVKRRFNTLWTLTRACEQVAEREGLACLFLTLSLPPEYHRNPSQGRRGGWEDGLTPIVGIEALQYRWRLIRARLRKEGIAQLGLWTQEPHEDGTPHRHLLVWTPPADVARLVEIYRAVFEETHATTEGGVAVNVKRWDASQAGKPSSYVMKYLTKTFAGGEEHVDRTEGTERHLENAERVAAWRRGVPGKRSFDFFGLKPGAVGVWGKVASLREKTDKDALKDETFGAAHVEIKAGKFADALDRLGLLAADQADKPWLVEKEIAVSSFGEPYLRPVRLHSETGGEIELHKDYEIVSKEEIERRAVVAAAPAAQGRAAAVAAGATLQAAPSVAVVVNYPRAGAGAPLGEAPSPASLPTAANEGRSEVA